MRIKDKYKADVVFDFDARKGTIQDQSANGYTVSTLPTGSSWSKNQYGRTYYHPHIGFFNYGDVGNISGSTGITILAKMKCDDLTGNSFVVGRDNGAGLINAYGMFFIGDEIRFRVTTTSTGASDRADLNTTSSPGDRKLHVVIATYSSTDHTMRIAVDGTIIKSSSVLASGTMLDSADQLNIGFAGGSAFDGSMNQIMIIKKGLTPEETAQLYEESLQEAFWTKKVIRNILDTDGTITKTYIPLTEGWNDSIGNDYVGLISNTEFQIVSGSWKVENDVGFKKLIRCVSTGIITVPSSIVYGTWEVDILKQEGSYIVFTFLGSSKTERLADDQNGYEIAFRSNEDVQCSEITGGSTSLKFLSSTSSVPVNEWFKIRVTRTSAGVTTVYISLDDGLTYTIINSTVSGDNPFTDTTKTTASDTLIQSSTGDKFKNFKFVSD